MKTLIYLSIFLSLAWGTSAQNVGIGTSNPTARLDVAGEVKIGSTNVATPQAGTMRWNANNNDFEGFNGTAWVSLTGGKSSWGSQQSCSYEDGGLLSGNSNARFGFSMAVEDSLLVVGLPRQLGGWPSVNGLGAATIYKQENGAWVDKNFLQQLELNEGAEFGYALALQNRTLVAGAPYADNYSKTRQGKAFVYSVANTGVANAATALTAIDGNTDDYFGSSVAVYNNRIIVGAPGKDIGFTKNGGAAYIFEKMGNAWQKKATLLSSTLATDDYAGRSVAICGNYAAVGAPLATINSNDKQGKVCLYKYNGTAWVQTATLMMPAGAHRQSFFGRSLQLTNDTLLIGMPQGDPLGSTSGNGKVFIYTRSNDTWNLQTTLTASNGQWGDNFGASIHLNGNYLIVGAERAKVGAAKAQGKAYIFKKNGSSWVQQAILTSSHGKDEDLLGTAVAITPDCAITGAPSAAYVPSQSLDNYEDVGRTYFFNHQ